MPSRKTRTPAPSPEVTSEPIVIGPEDGGNVLFAAWQGLYHLFGARAERIDVTPAGVVLVNVTVDEKYDFDQIRRDIMYRGDKAVNRRLDFLPLHFWANGEPPAHFTSSAQLTAWQTQFMKGAGEKGRSPQYAKNGIRDYKEANGLAVPRGRPRKTFKVTELGSLDPSALEGVDVAEITRLRETLDSFLSTAPVSASSES